MIYTRGKPYVSFINSWNIGLMAIRYPTESRNLLGGNRESFNPLGV
jgi:hypothetical protein